MRTLKRNQQTIKYALYLGREEIIEDGYRTGQYRNSYSDPVTMKAYVTANKGEAQAEAFGTSLNYSRILYTDDVNCPIDENSILWINGKAIQDYVVVRKAKSLNSIAYAIKEIDVSETT